MKYSRYCSVCVPFREEAYVRVDDCRSYGLSEMEIPVNARVDARTDKIIMAK